LNVSSVPAFPTTTYPRRIFEQTLVVNPLKRLRPARLISSPPNVITAMLVTIACQFQSKKLGAILLTD
jgi:hypothetical protein